jgi:DUF971 family protein
MSTDPSIQPLAVDSDGSRELSVTWEDEHVTRIDLVELRRACACAECTEFRQRGETIWPRRGAPEPLRVDHAELAGGYGLNIRWNDRHETGIYSWEMLRSSCPCKECRGRRP